MKTFPVSFTNNDYDQELGVSISHSPSYNLKDFGGDHLNTPSYDSAPALNNLLRYAKDKTKPVLIPAGAYYIKSPIDVDFKAIIKGEGKSITTLVFDFPEPLNAMNFYDGGIPSNGKGGESTISGIKFQYRQFNDVTHKNAHGLVFKNGMNDLTITNCEFLGFTGYGIYFDDGLAAETYGGNLVMRDLSFKRVGGAIGQNQFSNIGRWWFNICRLDNIRLDNFSGHAINVVSPQKFVYDFNGFRSLTIDNILAQGAIHNSVPEPNEIIATYRLGGGVSKENTDPEYYGQTKIHIKNLWEEFRTGNSGGKYQRPPVNLLVTNEGSNIEIDGFNKLRSSILKGDSYKVSLSNFRGRNISLATLIHTTGNVVIEVNNLISDGLKPTALSERSESDIRINSTTYFDGTVGIEDSEPHKGVNINIVQHTVLSEQHGVINEDRFIKLHHPPSHTHTLVDDLTEGRIYQVTGEVNSLPEFPFKINVTDEMVNEYIVLTMRFKMEVPDRDTTRFAYTVNAGPSITTKFQYGVETDPYPSTVHGVQGEGVNNPFDKWVNACFVFRPHAKGLYGFTTYNYVPNDALHIMKISCLRLSLGPDIHQIYNKVDHNNALTIIGRELPGKKPFDTVILPTP